MLRTVSIEMFLSRAIPRKSPFTRMFAALVDAGCNLDTPADLQPVVRPVAA